MRERAMRNARHDEHGWAHFDEKGGLAKPDRIHPLNIATIAAARNALSPG